MYFVSFFTTAKQQETNQNLVECNKTKTKDKCLFYFSQDSNGEKKKKKNVSYVRKKES